MPTTPADDVCENCGWHIDLCICEEEYDSICPVCGEWEDVCDCEEEEE